MTSNTPRRPATRTNHSHNISVRPQKRLTMFTFCFVPIIPLGNKQVRLLFGPGQSLIVANALLDL